jgi:hypothetical protein
VNLSRRGLFLGLGASLAAPAIVRVASIMPVRRPPVTATCKINWTMLEKITRESVRMLKNSNSFLQNIDRQYDDCFAETGANIGASLLIQLPLGFAAEPSWVESAAEYPIIRAA